MRLMFHHRIEHGDELAHDGHQCHLRGFASLPQALVEGAKDGIVACSDQGCHIERRT